ncbi:MAG TPA: alpha/beta hydrolase [Sphingorhabdus sp.]|nr:alpha/beta hydrolase [Sphingorhabdus sp.]
MTKTMLIAVLLLFAAAGIWLYRLGGPAQLELADRWWPGKADATGPILRGLVYGDQSNAQQSYDIYFPKGLSDGNSETGCKGTRYPALIFFHGGSWRDGDRESYAFVGRAFAARGFITFIADYRKAPANRFPDFVDDAAHAIASARLEIGKHGCADPGRLFVMGHSAGAHIAMLAALDPKWLAKHGLDASAIKGIIGLAGPYDFLPFTSDAARDALGHWPRPEETQPIHFANAGAPPMLLLTGDADTTVKPRNSRALAGKIAASGGKALAKFYPAVTHSGIIMAIARPFRGKAPVIDDILAFTADKSQ